MFPLTAEKLYLAYGVFAAVLVLLNLVRMLAESSGRRQTRQAAETRRQSARAEIFPRRLNVCARCRPHLKRQNPAGRAKRPRNLPPLPSRPPRLQRPST